MKYSQISDFLGSQRMETAPKSIEVILRLTLTQSDEPSDLCGSLSPTTRHRCTHVRVYTAPGRTSGHPSNYAPGPSLLNFSDQADTDELTPYLVYMCMCNM